MRGSRFAVAVLGTVTLLILATGTAATAGLARSVPATAQIKARPTSGQAGTLIHVRGRGFRGTAVCPITLMFIDANGTGTFLDSFDGDSFNATEVIPVGAVQGVGTLAAVRRMWTIIRHACVQVASSASTPFTVTP